MITSTKSKLAPTEQQILNAMNNIFQKLRSKTNKKKGNATTEEIKTARQLVEMRVREMLEDWKRGGHGHIDQTKTDRILRVYLENFNSLSIEKKGGQHWKSGAVDALRKKAGTQVMGGLKLQTNWDKISSRNQYHEVFGKGEDRTSIVAHNEHSEIFNQYGGTAMSVFGRMSSYTTSGKDDTGLGRWSRMAIDSGYKTTRFITAYRPVKKHGTTRNGKTTEGVIMCEQQRRYFCEVVGMDDPHPIKLFDKTCLPS